MILSISIFIDSVVTEKKSKKNLLKIRIIQLLSISL
jgi:hypothetical protein